MKVEDLKNLMKVELNNGCMCLNVDGRFYNSKGECMTEVTLGEDCFNSDGNYGIKAVYDVPKRMYYGLSHEHKGDKIWERNSEVVVTTEMIASKFGIDVKHLRIKE